MISQFLSWYLIVQLITLLALPLTASLFRHLPDRGYAFAKSLGILLVALFLWLGTAYGLLRNEAGGAWVSLLLMGGLGIYFAQKTFRPLLLGNESDAESEGERSDTTMLSRFIKIALPSARYVVVTELLFLLAFAVWAYVRAHDPAADHTEQPMDLMFMNGIWHSPTFPPRDPWLSGYAISYYYFGYWMLTTLARLAGLTPAVAYNVGQACWFGLLLLGSFGIAYNLLALSRRESSNVDGQTITSTREGPRSAYLGGYLASIAVGLTGNLLAPLEWLYANGYDISRMTDWLRIYNFPQNAIVTNDPLIGSAWWWWRSARVIEDLDLAGNHIEVIDEFPMFSYVLGDNHPHVLAMPFAILAVAFGLNLLLFRGGGSHQQDTLWRRCLNAIPLGPFGLFLMVVASGALIFLNTWDYPPYFLLLALCAFTVLWRSNSSKTDPSIASDSAQDVDTQDATAQDVNTQEATAQEQGLSFGNAFLGSVGIAAALVAGAILLYLPYFLTAQSQAGGFLPNLFYPTRFPQFMIMFGGLLPAVIVLLWLAWQEGAPDVGKLVVSAILVYGLPILWLVVSVIGANSFGPGRIALERVALPPQYANHTEAILERWSAQSLTFLVLALLLTVTCALIWSRWAAMNRGDQSQSPSMATFFALLLTAIGLLLVYAPEFIYLLDNFGTRMNTVFKFYYQAWLLLGLSGAYAIVRVWGELRRFSDDTGEIERSAKSVGTRRFHVVPKAVSAVALLLILSGLIYPIAGASSKTNGFSAEPSFSAIDYVARFRPDEYAAIEWIRNNTAPSALVLEAKGQSYRADFNRISTMTGRPTLMGWDGHESQWRGKAFGEMAVGRSEAIARVYQANSPLEISQTLTGWEIDYVYVGPTERDTYQIAPRQHLLFEEVMDLVFESGEVRIYAHR